MTVLTRRIAYADLRKGIRRGILDYAEKSSKGMIEVLSKGSTKGPIQVRVNLPKGPPLEPEVRLGKERIEVVLDDLQLSNYVDVPAEFRGLLAGMTLSLGGPLLDARAGVIDGSVHVEPLEIPYRRLRAPLYHVCKKILPSIARKYVDAEFRFSDPDTRIMFTGTKTVAVKFEGNLVFGEEHLVLQVSLQRLAVVAIPIVSSQLDAQLEKWTDGWDQVATT